MKTKLTKLAAGAVLGLGISISANAAFISYWFDPNGAVNGTTDAILVSEYLDFTGAVYAENTYTGPTTFNLEQFGYATILGNDGLGNALPYVLNNVVASFSGSGTGNLATESTSFTDGTIDLFVGGFAGTQIAAFNIIGGGAQIVSTSGAPNGASGLDGLATSFASNYFFFDNGGTIGADFSTIDLTEFILGFATSNLSLTTNQQTINGQRSILKAAFPAETFSTGNAIDGSGRLTNLYSGANGQFRLTQVPEPGTIALLGIGLLGLGAKARRRIKG
jgi:hypothetical protein